MKILVVGGTGILSTAVVERCIERGDSVTMINRGNRPNQIHPKATLIKCDIRDKNQLDNISKDLGEFDVVIDFLVFNASELNVSLQYFAKNTKQYVFISSAQVYNTSIGGLLTEDSPKPQKLWSYSVNKLECEKYLISYCKNNKINYTIIRPAVNYDGTRIPYGIFPPMGYHWTLVERIKHEKPIITWNHGQNRLNLTRVEDFAEATVGLMGNPKAYNEDFNVAGDNVYSWMDVLFVLGDLLGKKVVTFDLPVDYYYKELPKHQKEELVGGRANDMICSINKLKTLLPDFRPRYDLREGVKKTLDYYEKNNYLNGIDYVFDGDCDRIIKKYCRIKRIATPPNCDYIDYFNGGKDYDKNSYYSPYYKDRISYRVKHKLITLIGGVLPKGVKKILLSIIK